MAKHFSKKYRNKGWASTIDLQSYVRMPVSAWCYTPTSLLQEQSSILYYLMLNSGIGHQQACSQPCERGLLGTYMPSPFYPSSVVLFQLLGAMVSHMQVLATHFSTLHNSKYLVPYLWNHTNFSCLFLRSRSVRFSITQRKPVWRSWWLWQLLLLLLLHYYYYYEFIARNDGFWQAPEIDFLYETKARKVMIDFKFDALYS